LINHELEDGTETSDVPLVTTVTSSEGGPEARSIQQGLVKLIYARQSLASECCDRESQINLLYLTVWMLPLGRSFFVAWPNSKVQDHIEMHRSSKILNLDHLAALKLLDLLDTDFFNDSGHRQKLFLSKAAPDILALLLVSRIARPVHQHGSAHDVIIRVRRVVRLRKILVFGLVHIA
jgi:hypothetical protein